MGRAKAIMTIPNFTGKESCLSRFRLSRALQKAKHKMAVPISSTSRTCAGAFAKLACGIEQQAVASFSDATSGKIA